MLQIGDTVFYPVDRLDEEERPNSRWRVRTGRVISFDAYTVVILRPHDDMDVVCYRNPVVAFAPFDSVQKTQAEAEAWCRAQGE